MVPPEDRRRSRVIELMRTPDFYPHPVESVTMRETHISLVFLTGDFVYKIKKPVDLDFLDFTTLEQRQHFCNRELELNRRLTHDVYLDVVAVTCQDGHCRLEGSGRPVEYAVKMRQLTDAATMQRRFANNKLDSTDIDLLARVLDRFYRSAPTGIGVNAFGEWSTVRRNCEENFSQTEEFAGNVIDRRKHQIIKSATRTFLRRRKALFDLRVKDNKIREGNSVLLDATFSRKGQRREVSRLAADMDADILFIECRCGDKVLRQRLAERDNSPGVSDARLKHLNAFKARYEELDEIADEILITIDTEMPTAENLAEILARHG